MQYRYVYYTKDTSFMYTLILLNRLKSKKKTTKNNTTLLEESQNPIQNQYEKTNPIPLTHKYMTVTFLTWYTDLKIKVAGSN